MKYKIDIIPHWKLFDVIEYPNGKEWSILFVKFLVIEGRCSYYLDSIGLGIDLLRTSKYTSVSIRLIAFSLHFQKRKQRNLKLVG